jgi:uncharacterized membrane protein YgcG
MICLLVLLALNCASLIFGMASFVLALLAWRRGRARFVVRGGAGGSGYVGKMSVVGGGGSGGSGGR